MFKGNILSFFKALYKIIKKFCFQISPVRLKNEDSIRSSFLQVLCSRIWFLHNPGFFWQNAYNNKDVVVAVVVVAASVKSEWWDLRIKEEISEDSLLQSWRINVVGRHPPNTNFKTMQASHNDFIQKSCL